MERLEDFFLEEKTIPDDLLWYGAVSFQKDGAVIPWRIGTLDAKSGEALRRACTNDRGVTDMGAFLMSVGLCLCEVSGFEKCKIARQLGCDGRRSTVAGNVDCWGIYIPLLCRVVSQCFPGPYANAI